MKTGVNIALRARRNVQVITLSSFSTAPRSKTEAPDPITFVGSAAVASRLKAEWLAQAGERYWLGVVGAIDPRKNIELLTSALARVDASNIGLVIAGKSNCSEEVISAWLQPAVDRDVPIVRLGKLLSDEEIDSIVLALDCVVIAHSNEGPSGLFGKAAAAGTRVLAAGARSLRRDADALPDLSSWVPLDPESLAAEIERIVALPSPVPIRTETRTFTRRLVG